MIIGWTRVVAMDVVRSRQIVELTEFADNWLQDVRRERRERMTLRFLISAIERMELPFSEMGRAVGKAPLGGREAVWLGHLDVEMPVRHLSGEIEWAGRPVPLGLGLCCGLGTSGSCHCVDGNPLLRC